MTTANRSALAWRRGQRIVVGALALAGLYLVSRYNFLLFHSLAELFSIVVAAVIFIIAWNARRLYDNAFLLVVGIGFLFVAMIDLVHALAYKGMNVFPGRDANLPTQLWIVARSLQAVTLLVAPVALGRTVKAPRVLALAAVITIALLVSVFQGWFPVAYVDEPGGGLTPFKVAAEYVIAAALAVALGLLHAKREHFHPPVLRFLYAGLALIIASEVAFTQYVSVYGAANVAGHLLKILAFYCIYRAIVQTALAEPFTLLFRELKQREAQLEAAREMQEQMTDFVVHDLRSPLTSMLGGIEALRADGDRLTDAQRQLADAALASGAWVLSLADSLLDASRLESGKLPLQPAAVEAKALVDASLLHVSTWARLAQVGFDLKVTTDGTQVLADPDVTVRILVNLLSNAIKFSPPDSTVTIQVAPSDGQVTFAVSDQGPGIPPEWAGKVFERFGHVQARQAGAAGTGLGLAFCRLAVEAQGGSIHLDSMAGRGTTVTFTLPTAARPPQQAAGIPASP